MSVVKIPAVEPDAGAATFLSNFRKSHTSVFWNLVWHCADIKVSFEFLLPGLSVQLSSARDSAVHCLPNNLTEGAVALEAALVSSPGSDIPTMSLLEFEQDSKNGRPQPNLRRSDSGRAPSKPLPVPSGNTGSILEAPAKDLPPLPSAAAVPAERSLLEDLL
jgi:hypothetical protein